MLNPLASATIGSRKVRLTPPNEGIWTLAGVIFGILLPVRNWGGMELKVWIVIFVIVGALAAVIAAKLLKVAFSDMPKDGWSISRILVCANASDASKRSRHLAYWAIGLFALMMLIGGAMAGQVVAIYVGLGASH